MIAGIDIVKRSINKQKKKQKQNQAVELSK